MGGGVTQQGSLHPRVYRKAFSSGFEHPPPEELQTLGILRWLQGVQPKRNLPKFREKTTSFLLAVNKHEIHKILH